MTFHESFCVEIKRFVGEPRSQNNMAKTSFMLCQTDIAHTPRWLPK